jgi:hypothetical protein
MNDLDYSAIEKALGVEPSSIAEMPEEIRAKMKTGLETIVVRTDEDRKELYNSLDLLWQKGSVLLTLEKVSKATGIPMVTLSNLDFETQQVIVFEYLANSANTKQIYMLTNSALAVIELDKIAKLIAVRLEVGFERLAVFCPALGAADRVYIKLDILKPEP